MILAPYCFCTIVTKRSLTPIHEAGSDAGSFKDRHPWHVAKQLLQKARGSEQRIAILFAVEETHCLSEWALIRDIDVATYSGQKFETACTFDSLRPVNPIFEQLDSVVLLPSAEQRHRESVEPIRHYRQHLDLLHIRPYAICETPSFMYAELKPTEFGFLESQDEKNSDQ